jgi:iron complex outermembrane receptor protein
MMRKIVASIALCLLLVISTAVDSRADGADQDQSKDVTLKLLSLEQLGNVEVTTASKEPEEVWRTAAAIYVITQEDIRRSGVTSIPEVLRLVPGVEVAQIDSSTWSIGIRGFGSGFSKSVLVLIDGRNVYTPLFAGVNWRLQNVLLEDVDRIEVVRGPGGTIWGTNAVNGVINIITKNSKDSHGALVSVGGGNVDQGTGEFRYGGALSKNLNYRVYGMAFGRAPEFHTDLDNVDGWQLGQGGFRMDWDDQKRDTLTLQGDLYKGEVGERENIATYSPPASNNIDGAEDVSGANLLGRWQRKFAGGSDIQVQGYYDRTYRLGSQLGETRNTVDIDFIHHITLLPRQDIIWGLGARWSPSDFIQTVATVDFLPHRQSDNIYSAFLQDELSVIRNKLAVTIGSKFEHNIYTGWEIQPSVRLLWTPSPHQTVWAAVSRAVRSPSRLDEDLQLTGFSPANATTPEFFLRIAGDPAFVSEQLLGYEIGYRALITSKFYFDLSGFRNDYNDLTSYGNASFSAIVPPPVPPAPPPLPVLLITIPYANGLKGVTTGVEIAPDWKITDWWQLKGSYSYLYLKTEDRPGYTDSTTVATDNGSSPHHEIVIQSLINLPKRFEFDPAYRYVSALPIQQIPAYSTADVRLGWHAAERVEFSLGGQNLMQPHHVEFSGDPGPLVWIKRSVYAKITWRR